MLKGIDPLLSGELLCVLDDMGHGDQLALVDRNFPAYQPGRPVIRLGESGSMRALDAILSMMPLDSFVTYPIERMEVKDDPSIVLPTQQQVFDRAKRIEGWDFQMGVIPRMDFYQRAKSCFAVVHTLETEPYSCFILHKGVI
jgi:L-fucose mutarotase